MLLSQQSPWGTGKNVIVVGGSDAAGAATAADELLKLPSKDRSWVLPRLHQARLSSKLVALAKERQGSPTKQVRRGTDWPQLPVDWAYALGYGPIPSLAIEYLWTGNLEAAQAYKQAMLKRGSGFSHFDIHGIPLLWDLMEEAPVFTDEERLRITNNILTFLRGPEGTQYGAHYRGHLSVRAPRQNHGTRLAVGVYFGADYCWKHYRLPEAERWLKEVEQFWAPQMHSSKPQCDSNGHQWAPSLENAATYALASGHMEFFTEGHVREAAERHLAVIRTRGGMAALGDSGAGAVSPGLLTKAAHFYKDGRYLYPLFAVRKPITYSGEVCRPFADDVAPVKPSDHVGVRWAPVAPLYYHWWKNAPSQRNGIHEPNVPLDKCFDKLAFRGGWKYQDEYLLLDGISGGSHAYDDANSIIEVCVNDRTFIATHDRTIGVRYVDHNAVAVTRDGVGTKAPGFARLNLAADLNQYALSDTEVLDYGGTDAKRLILWRKGGWWLVLDEVRAKQKGNFSLRCHWHVLGDTQLVPAGLRIAQASGQRFHIASPTPSQQSLNRDDSFLSARRALHDEYEHAESGRSLYRQVVVANCEPGARRGFVNLLYADQHARPRKLTIERIGETAARITDAKTGEVVLGAVGSDSIKEVAGIAWKGRCVCVSAGTVVLAGGTELSILGQTLVRSDTPISVELDVKSGRAVAIVDRATSLELAGTHHKLDRGRAELNVPGISRFADLAGRAISGAKPMPRPSDGSVRTEPHPPLWKLNVGGPVLALAVSDVDGDGNADIAFGTKAKTMGVASGEGKLRWSHQARGAVGTVAIFDLDGDGAAEVVAGNDDDKVCSYSKLTNRRTIGLVADKGTLAKTDESRVSAFSSDGKRLWESGFKIGQGHLWTLYSSNIRKVLAADLDGDGQGEIYAGCGNMHLYRLSHAGKIDWGVQTRYGVVTRIIAADADSDGKPEILAGAHPLSAGATCWILSPDGVPNWQLGQEGWTSSVSAIQVGDLDGDGKQEVLNGTKKGGLYVRTLPLRRTLPQYDDRFFWMDPSRYLLWSQNFGDTVTDLALVPAASGKGLDIIASSATGYVTRLDATGKRLWSTALSDEVLCSAMLGEGSESRVVCGCVDGGVYVLRLDGSILGRVETGGRVRCVAALQSDRAVAGSDDGFLYGFRLP